MQMLVHGFTLFLYSSPSYSP
ncbi:unnamed protein product [Spirodela intermedia]|uniref:Uncharacterized protein n=2 Tax=Spirodela intermedia TaxID=51605 RepID=A0A7I8JX75_SPIIN|nr:unnamed protein product [Spirodela intermedia]CAA6654002.1 unnamed protein product [Spirodela intermedia]CAA7388451.1 unnamed protein product [Spirodela intermedia]